MAAETVEISGQWPMVGHFLPFIHNPLALLDRGRRENGPIFHTNVFGTSLWVMNEPAAVKHIFVDHPDRYTKQTQIWKRVRQIVGNGLLTSDGDFWKRQRRIIQPAFHRERLGRFAQIMAEEVDAQVVSWGQSALIPDLAHTMMALTLKIVVRSLFSSSVAEDTASIARALDIIVGQTIERGLNPLSAPAWLPTPANQREAEARATMDGLVFRLITERRQAMTRGEALPHDLLSMLLEVKDADTGEGMTDIQLRDEVLTLVAAGHETTAGQLTWALFLAARHPEVLANLRGEWDQVLGGRPPAMEDLPKLRLTKMALNEGLRLYPPAWFIGRFCEENDIVCGQAVKRGESVNICPWLLHRDARHWEHPTEFHPEHFLPKQEDARPKYLFVPFGAGPRVCIGSAFAAIEAAILFAHMAQKMDIVVMNKEHPRLRPGITLRALDKIPVRVTRR